jgi:hypothetical protein
MALFKVTNTGLESLTLHSFRDHNVGGQGEQTLQDFISDFPDLIPGEEIDADEPPTFVVIKAEAGVSSGSLDILLVDQKAMPTVIEAKLIDNREIRRSVVAQGIEYMAHLQAEWSSQRFLEEGSEYWSKKGGDFLEMFENRLGKVFDEDYGRQLEGNIRAGRMRLIIAADELPKEAVRILEFLNQTASFDALGMELTYYFNQASKETILAPRMIGQSVSATQRKRATTTSVWDYDRFMNEITENQDGEIAELAKYLINEGQEITGQIVQWGTGSEVGTAKIKVQVDGCLLHLFSVGTDGRLGIYFGWNGRNLSEELLRNFLNDGNKRFNAEWTEKSWFDGFPSFLLKQLAPDRGDDFLSFVREFVIEAEKELVKTAN